MLNDDQINTRGFCVMSSFDTSINLVENTTFNLRMFTVNVQETIPYITARPGKRNQAHP